LKLIWRENFGSKQRRVPPNTPLPPPQNQKPRPPPNHRPKTPPPRTHKPHTPPPKDREKEGGPKGKRMRRQWGRMLISNRCRRWGREWGFKKRKTLEKQRRSGRRRKR